MRVLQFSKGSELGGLAVFAKIERDLLQKHITVEPFYVDTAIKLETAQSRKGGLARIGEIKGYINRAKAKIDAFQPDILHIHSLLPFITPAIIRYAHNSKIPMVFTLHDYKLLYHDGMIYRNDPRRFWNDLFRPDRWKHGSLPLTLLYGYLLNYYRGIGLYNKVDRFIAPSGKLYHHFIQQGFNEDAMEYIPHFMPDFSDMSADSGTEQHENEEKDSKIKFLYLGRLSPEKGVHELVYQWITQEIPYQLDIVGSGVLKSPIARSIRNNSLVRLLGDMPWEDGVGYLSSSTALVVPSICYESFGLNILEAFVLGKPVICTEKAGRRELVQSGETALTYKAGDAEDLKEQVLRLAGDVDLRNKLGRAGRKRYEENFTPDNYLDAILQVYKSVMRK